MDKSPFAEHQAALSRQEALVEANRCLFCFDAPCVQACPTHIEIPSFIKKISTGNLKGSARVILEANFLGSTCARVCPVEELCEGACVIEEKPIQIGRLQRYSTDYVRENNIDLFKAGKPSGKKVAIVGSGPAGLSAAAELAKLGHAVTIFEKRELAGGRSTYGIIVLREPVEIALSEVEMVKKLGVEVKTNVEIDNRLKHDSQNVSLDELRKQFDAVFLAVGLGSVPNLGIDGEENILDGIKYIEKSKIDPKNLPKANRVVVIGAGNTAIDAATIAKRSGAEVTMVYRRTEKDMTAYQHEYNFARLEAIQYRFLTKPNKVITENGQTIGLECLEIALGDTDESGRAAPKAILGSEFVLKTDLVIKAIGQEKPDFDLEREKGFIKVNNMQTSKPGIFAGGDCIRAKGAASTVMAVQDGKLAARAIDEYLRSK